MTAYIELADNLVAGVLHTMTPADSLYVREGVLVGSNNGGIAIDADALCKFEIYGQLTSIGGLNATIDAASDETIYIGANGSVTGHAAIDISDGGNVIVNDGTIHGEVSALTVALSGDTHLLNNGSITSVTSPAISLAAGDNKIANSGTIGSFSTCVVFNSTASDTANALVNSGTIIRTAATPAITGGDSLLTVTNTGTIVGGINFGAAGDNYFGDLGKITGIIQGAGGDDTIICGAGRNLICGGAGSDSLDGGDGRDLFLYAAISESGGTAHDTLVGFDGRKDKFDLSVAVTGIDATVASGQLRAAHFVNDVKAAVGAPQLAAHHAVLFTPTTGDLAGHVILVVEANGAAGFQTGDKDYVFDLTDADNLGALNTGDFI